MGVVVVFRQEDTEFGAILGLEATSVEIAPLEEGSDYLEAREVDLAIIDCGSNCADGLGLLRQIKESRPEVPIIFVTEASSEEVVLNAYKYGAREYFRSPFDPADLREAAERILRFKRDEPATRRGGEELILRRPLPERLRRSIGYMEQHLTTSLPLEKIAEVACLSKYHFCRRFKKHLGITPIQFMLDLRIRHAATLLRDTGLSVTSVAARTGFSDLSGFHRHFKRVYRCTPTAYRRSLQNRKPFLPG